MLTSRRCRRHAVRRGSSPSWRDIPGMFRWRNEYEMVQICGHGTTWPYIASPQVRCLWVPWQRCAEWLTSNGKSIAQSDLEHSQALTRLGLRMAGRGHTSASQSIVKEEGWNGPWTQQSAATSPAPHHGITLRSLHRPNQIKVMYGNNAMDFPSTYGLSLSLDDPRAKTHSGSNLERLVDLSTRRGKGHTLSRSLQLISGCMWHAGCVWARARVQVDTQALVLIDRILFVFPRRKFTSASANRQYAAGNFITGLTRGISLNTNSITADLALGSKQTGDTFTIKSNKAIPLSSVAKLSSDQNINLSCEWKSHRFTMRRGGSGPCKSPQDGDSCCASSEESLSGRDSHD